MSKKDYLMIGKVKPNTFIGGVGGVITTKELLADKLSVTADQIQSFEIDAQNNVSCYIGVEYQITQLYAFDYSTRCSSYIDEDDLCTSLGNGVFRFNRLLNEIKLDALVSISENAFSTTSLKYVSQPNLTTRTGVAGAWYRIDTARYAELPVLTNMVNGDFRTPSSEPSIWEYIYAPRCTKLGDSVSVNNLCFDYLPVNCVVYLDPILWAVNAGNPDPDLQYLIDRGNDVRAVTNFDIPTIPINITKVNDYGAIVDISWVQPIGSTNAIDYYQIYVNGEYNGRTVSNETNYRIENLNQYSFYTVQVVACDYFYNQSYSEMINIETGFNTAVSQITDLAIDTLYSVAVAVDFTTPTSIYNVDYYEVYLDNNFYKNQTTHPIAIGNLTNGQTYGIKVIAVDINGNKSEYSNILNVLIDGVNPYPVPSNNVISEYKFENNVIDTVGSDNGIPISITYEDGLVDRSALFNGNTSYFTIQDYDGIDFSNAFSVSFAIAPEEYLTSPHKNPRIVDKINANNDQIFRIVLINGVADFIIYDTSNANAELRIRMSDTIPLNNWSHIACTYDGGDVMKAYFNGVESFIDISLGGFVNAQDSTGSMWVGRDKDWVSNNFKGGMDCLRFFDINLTPTQLLELATLELSGIDITP